MPRRKLVYGMTVQDLRQGFVAPADSSRPMMRWWWFGPAVERTELDRELVAMADAGIGGVEVAFVYPLSPVEDVFGSEAFLDHVRFAARRAHELGLRFDLTLGSGWSFGGRHIGVDLAARSLHWDSREITGSALDVPVVSAWPGDELITAFLGAGADGNVGYSELQVSDGCLRIPEGSGPRRILLAYSRLTGQNVKRAAAGAEGPVLDHYSAEAITEHLRCVAEPLLAAASPELVGSVFCDSLEVYGADWTANAFDEFARRRGYDLRPRLYQLAVDGDGSDALRRDYYRTLSELYEDNFVKVVQQWASSHRVPFRIQSYGEPPATVSSYRHADLYEGEGWGWLGLPQTRWASSAAHLYGEQVVSAEAWTWIHSPSFRATPLDIKGEAHEHFLAGVNHFVGHGWPYSPQEAPGLGWFFYAAGALDDRNSWWPAASDLNRYLQRLCWLLRQGRPVADVKLYVPAGDAYAAMGTASGSNLYDLVKRQIGPEVPRIVREAGLDFDLIDDDGTAALAPTDVQIVIVPGATVLPEPTRQWLADVATSGGCVIAVASPAAPDLAVRLPDSDGLEEALHRALDPDITLSPRSAGVGVTHRRLDDADVYFVANTTPEVREFDLSVRTVRPWYEEWSPDTGDVVRSGQAGAGVHLLLHPYQATVLVFSELTATELPQWQESSRSAVGGSWSVQFADQPGERLPIALPHRWEDDPNRAAYSGSATYETEFDAELMSNPDVRVVLDLGDSHANDGDNRTAVPAHSFRAMLTPPVGVIAEVTVNGAYCGALWAPPYTLDISDQLRSGRNTLAIKVCNTAANALAHDTTIQAMVEDSTRRYGLRFVMQDLDKATDTVASGLLDVPSLSILKRNN